MTNRTQRQAASLLTSLALLVLLAASAASFTTIVSADEPSLRELAVESREQAAVARNTKLRRILARQKDNQLKVYLNSNGTYVNGLSLSADDLQIVIAESGLKKAVITAGLEVHPQRMSEMQDRLRKLGLKSVELDSPKLTLREVAVESRERAVRGRNSKLREILASQKGDQLNVYLNSRGAYVNGKSVSASDLQTIVSESNLNKATLTSEPSVADEKITNLQDLIRKAGIKQINLAKTK